MMYTFSESGYSATSGSSMVESVKISRGASPVFFMACAPSAPVGHKMTSPGLMSRAPLMVRSSP